MFTGLQARRWAVASAIAVCIGIGMVALLRHPVIAFDADAKEDEKAEVKAPEPFEIPDTEEPKELFTFIKDLSSEEKEFASEDEQREHILRVMATQVAVADKILKSDELDDFYAERAAKMKIQGLVNLAMLGVTDGVQHALDAVDKMTKDERSAIADFAKENQRVVRIILHRRTSGCGPRQAGHRGSG